MLFVGQEAAMSKRKNLWNRREVLAASLAPALAGAEISAQESKPRPLAVTAQIYESIGVRPFINARGTFTILTGSQTLPEVKQAMTEASRHFVHMDELMDAV